MIPYLPSILINFFSFTCDFEIIYLSRLSFHFLYKHEYNYVINILSV